MVPSVENNVLKMFIHLRPG